MAWSFVGVSATATATATPLTLTEPAGVAAGDLLIACIASRTTSTTSIVNTGWTLVNEQKTNNTLTTTSAIASGVMLYQVRGASAPDLTFTLPASGTSVVFGRMVAYRGNAATTPLDASTAVTTAINTTAVSVAGLTTTQADDLIVAIACGGQEATWSAFNNVTTPIGASGATDTSTAPSTTAWIERADSSTTTGADTSLAIFDAIRTAAGATGNLTATASLGAGHVVIAGAFKPPPVSIDDAWNVNDKSTSITLSGADKTATGTAAGSSVGVRSTQARVNGSAGKYYGEFLLHTAAITIGIAPASLSLGSTSSSFVFAGSTGNIVVNAVVLGNLGAASISDIISVAWDSGAELVWIRRNAGNWNNSGTADPAAGVGGIDCSFAASTDHHLYFRGFNLNDSVTIRTEAAEFTYSGPSGFTSWMGETLSVSTTGAGAPASQASTASGDGIVGAPAVAEAWDVWDKTANITLSSGDKTATLSSPLVNSAIRSTQQIPNEAAGKYYAELLLGVVSGVFYAGIKSRTSALQAILESVRVSAADGEIYYVGSTVLGNIGSALVSGDVICIAWDSGAELIWFRKDDGLWNDDAAADPATGANGLDASPLGSVDLCLWFTATNSGNSVTIRTEVAELGYAGPSGFTSWMGEELPVAGTGTPVAQASDADGVGISASAGTGAPASQASTASGVGLSASAGTGALAALAVAVSGDGVVSATAVSGTGALAAQDATASGAGISASAGTGSIIATAATIAGLAVSSSIGSGAANDNAATVAGIGISASVGAGALAADGAAIIGSGDVSSAAVTGTGNAAAAASTVSGAGVSASVAIGALAAQSATAAGAGISESIGSGALVAGAATVAGQGIVVEEGVAIGTGALAAGTATIAGIGEISGAVVQPPVFGGGGIVRPPRPFPVEGYGYGILPQLEGESHGVVLAVGLGAGALPAPGAELAGAVGAAGRSLALLDVRGTASGDRGQAGAAVAELKELDVIGSGAAVVRGKGVGMIVALEGAAKGRHEDDEAAAVAWLLAA